MNETKNKESWLKNELKAVGLTMLYFGSWIAALLLLKQLVLAEYSIAFHHFSLAFVGALIMAKVVLLLEHAPLGSWVRNRPAWVDVLVRTILYSCGVVPVLVLEKGFEGRHEHGGFGPAVSAVFHAVEGPHVWANTICLSGALLGYNMLSVVQQHLGAKKLLQMFTSPLPEASSEDGIK